VNVCAEPTAIEPRMIALNDLYRRLDDAMHPVVVKELRQAVSGRFYIGWLVVYLIVQLFVLGGYISTSQRRGVMTERGAEAFVSLVSVLVAICILVVPIYAAVRISMERSEPHRHLLLVTPLRPGSILRGKVYSAMILVGQFFAVTAPFMSLTYLLRGIDLPSIFAVVVIDLIAVTTCVVFAVAVAALASGVAGRMVAGVIGGGGLLFVLSATVGVNGALVYGGALTHAEFWAGLIVGYLIVGFFVLLLFASAIEAWSPRGRYHTPYVVERIDAPPRRKSPGAAPRSSKPASPSTTTPKPAAPASRDGVQPQ